MYVDLLVENLFAETDSTAKSSGNNEISDDDASGKVYVILRKYFNPQTTPEAFKDMLTKSFNLIGDKNLQAAKIVDPKTMLQIAQAIEKDITDTSYNFNNNDTFAKKLSVVYDQKKQEFKQTKLFAAVKNILQNAGIKDNIDDKASKLIDILVKSLSGSDSGVSKKSIIMWVAIFLLSLIFLYVGYKKKRGAASETQGFIEIIKEVYILLTTTPFDVWSLVILVSLIGLGISTYKLAKVIWQKIKQIFNKVKAWLSDKKDESKN